VFAPRGRLALADEVLHQLATFGVAWPALLGALVLGALCFEWRGPTWKPGAIEVPKREALALGALLAASAAALALPWSPRFEAEALVALFPLCALLAGLLLIPPEDLPLPRES
jgi:peptidoglycan/LPS O-acetylase OafA/YrhL